MTRTTRGTTDEIVVAVVYSTLLVYVTVLESRSPRPNPVDVFVARTTAVVVCSSTSASRGKVISNRIDGRVAFSLKAEFQIDQRLFEFCLRRTSVFALRPKSNADFPNGVSVFNRAHLFFMANGS